MAKMYRGGDTLAVIAAAFDVSRAVIAGLVSRNPEVFPKEEREKQRQLQKAADAAAKAAKSTQSEASKRRGVSAPTHQAGYLSEEDEERAIAARIEKRLRAAKRAFDTRHMQLAGSKTVPFIDCGEFQCRLVISGSEDALGPDAPCCGRPVAEGSAYCPQHLKLMYRTPGRAA
ncbi:hypothetical protein AZF01_06395 [Martelella sp. AD-3]|nr:hypothetical protein AZF01_06395 [Martelella sp. AD-3]